MQNYLNIGKSARYLGVSVDSLRRWERSGKLRSYRSPGGHRYFLKNDLEVLQTHSKTYTRSVKIKPIKKKSINKKLVYLLIGFVILDIILILIYIYN